MLGQLHEPADGKTYQQLHEHADGDTCWFRQWDDKSRHQFTQFLTSKDSKQVLREGLETALQESATFKDSLERALQERSTFKYICDYMHSQQDRGSGQRHALRQLLTVGRGMQAVAENSEEESARPPAAAHEHASNQRRTSFYAEARGGAALDGRAYSNAKEEESDENFEGVSEPSICLNAYFVRKCPDPVPGVKKEGKMCKAGDLKETEMWHGHRTMQQVNHANLKHMSRHH